MKASRLITAFSLLTFLLAITFYSSLILVFQYCHIDGDKISISISDFTYNILYSSYIVLYAYFAFLSLFVTICYKIVQD